MTPCPLGSGKFGTPFARMHSESLSAFCGFPVWIAKFECWPLGGDPVEGPAPLSGVPPLPFVVDDEAVWPAEVVEVLTFATPGLLAPAPQPATRVPITSTDATEPRPRGPGPRRWRSVTASAGRIVGDSFA